ncbi:hypothetical protein [Shewanella sp. 30m-9]
MDLSRHSQPTQLSQLTQLRYSYFAVPVIYILGVVWLPAAALWIGWLGWVGVNWYRIQSPVLKQGYWVILQSLGLHLRNPVMTPIVYSMFLARHLLLI